MNPIIITIIIATASFILTVFGATWLNNRANDKRMDDFKLYIDARFDTVRSDIANLATRVDRIERQLESLFKPIRSGD